MQRLLACGFLGRKKATVLLQGRPAEQPTTLRTSTVGNAPGDIINGCVDPGAEQQSAAGLADGSAVGIPYHRPATTQRPEERAVVVSRRPVGQADPTFIARVSSARVYPPRSGRAGFTGYYGRGVFNAYWIYLLRFVFNLSWAKQGRPSIVIVALLECG